MRERILVIDGNLGDQRRLTRSVLEPHDYDHLQARSGREGLRLMQDRDPAVIILDHHLPDKDSFELLCEIQGLDAGMPVIFTSTDQSARTILRAFRSGASDFVRKPFESAEVLAALQRTVRDEHTLSKHRDLTRRLREAHRQLQVQFQELGTVYAIGRAVTSLLDLNQVLNRVVEAAVYTVGAEEGTLMLLDDESDELYLRAAKDVGEEAARNLRLRVDDSAAGRALRTNRPVHLTGDSVKLATGYLVKSLLYVPLRVPGRGTIGVLGVANRWTDQVFSQRDIRLVSAMADYAAIAIDNARLFKHAETERAKLEAVLREAEEAIIVVDEDGRVLLCNAAACDIWRLNKEDLFREGTPRRLEEVISDSDILELFSDTSGQDGAIHREVTLGKKRTYKAHLTPVEGVGHVLMLQDISHLKELDRLKSEFVATVSHDLRTPLTSIQGYVELLPKVGPLNERQEQFIGRVRVSLKNITDLINDLLDIRRIESELDLDVEPCDLREIIDEVVERLGSLAEAKEQDLRWERPDALPLIEGHPGRLTQVVDNLVNNAVKYTQEGGLITISAHQDDGHVVVHVSDDGLGIPVKEQPHIFDKFYRVQTAAVDGVDGTGLGLAIVKAVIEKHGGRIWVESKPGVGSTFSFILPAIKDES